MKLTPFITAAFAASALLFTACDKAKEGGGTTSTTAPVSEKDAIEGFKKGVMEIDGLMGEMKAAGNPATGMPKLKEAIAKMASLKTDGLPADLKSAFEGVKGNVMEMADIFKGMPEKAEDAEAFMGKLMQDKALGEKMQKSREAGIELKAKFKEALAKIGVELKNMD